MVNFKPISDKEEKELKNNLIANGTILDFVVIPEITFASGKSQATEIKLSSESNNLRLNTVIELYNKNGNKVTTLIDFTNMFQGKMAWKGKHFCESIGLQKEYEAGDLDGIAKKCIGKTGKCEIGIQKSTDPNYPDDKNFIKDYLVTLPEAVLTGGLDDDIPL